MEQPYEIKRVFSRKLWFPLGYQLDGDWPIIAGRIFRWPPPRLIQLWHRFICGLAGHVWSDWRIETEEWFDQPVPEQLGAWRTCQKECGAIEHCLPIKEVMDEVQEV